MMLSLPKKNILLIPLSLCLCLALIAGCSKKEDGAIENSTGLLEGMVSLLPDNYDGKTTSFIDINIQAQLSYENESYDLTFIDKSTYESYDDYIIESLNYSFDFYNVSDSCDEITVYDIGSRNSYMLLDGEYESSDYFPGDMNSIYNYIREFNVDKSLSQLKISNDDEYYYLKGLVAYPDNYRIWRKLTGNSFCSWSSYLYPDYPKSDDIPGSNVTVSFYKDSMLIKDIVFNLKNVVKWYVCDLFALNSDEIDDFLDISKCTCKISVDFDSLDLLAK